MNPDPGATGRRSPAGAGRRRLVAAATLAALLVTGCSSTGPETAPGGQSASRSAGADEALSLRSVCPETVVVQTNWWPQAEYGGLYQLLGTGPQVDRDRKRVTGPLVVSGVDTGVRLEIRSGGPANSYTPAARTLYLDPAVTLGGLDIDQAVQFSRTEQPAQAVFAPLEKSPLVLMWDPATHPGFRTVEDIGRTDTRVLYFQGSAYMDYLVAAGKLRKSQVESSYDGTPARFVAERGAVVQQGFLTNEIYQYERELPQWKKKVGWALVADTGYPNYPEALAVRPDRKVELAPCLRKLVPVLQRGAVEYASSPKVANELIVRLVEDFGAFRYSPERAAFAIETLLANGLVGNGPNAAIGDFDLARVDRLIEVNRPAAPAGGAAAPAPRSGDLVTNEFIDPAIGLQ
jgi:hypothetical protein